MELIIALNTLNTQAGFVVAAAHSRRAHRSIQYIMLRWIGPSISSNDWQIKNESQVLANLAEAEASLARRIETIRSYTPSTYIPGVGQPPTESQDQLHSDEGSDASTEAEQEMAMLDESLDFEESSN